MHPLDKWKHSHKFNLNNNKAEKRTYYVLILTAITMIVEIAAGTMYGSMALLADGWHMGTHVTAFMITIFAYSYAKKYENDDKYSFGTGKVNVLAGFTSAIALGIVSLLMVAESVVRFFEPQAIHFNEAILVAVIGLVVNVASMFILHDHDHHHEHHNEEHAHEHHHDYNIKAAYFHVLADALTSLFAIFALLLGKYYGWNWLDPLMGIVGGIIIAKWSIGLVKDTSPILLDETIKKEYKEKIKEKIENDSDNIISDIHIWRISANHYASIISIVTHSPKSTEYYKDLLKDFHKLSHISIEINECDDKDCKNDYNIRQK
jgi:cation diffusion facilitator family transporter